MLEQGVVGVVVDGVVRLVVLAELVGVFPGNHGLVLCAEFEMFVLENAGKGDVFIGVVDHSVALKISPIEHFGFKVQAAVLQRSQFAVEKLINLAGIEHPLGLVVPVLSIVEVVDAGPDFHVVQ